MSDLKKAYISEVQKKNMLEYIKKHPELISGKFSQKFTFKDGQQRWEELATILNSIPGGSQKDWKSWRKTWQDIRSRTKVKEATLVKCRRSTGGGTFTPDTLTDIEKGVLEIIKSVSIEGHTNVTESIVTFDIAETNVSSDCEMSTENKENMSENKDTTPDVEVQLDNTSMTTPTSSKRTVPRRSSVKLKQTSIAVTAYENYLTKKLESKERYYEKKIAIMQQVATAKDRSATALEKIADCVQELV